MKSLPVIPHVGIGPLKLGMSPEEMIDAINQVHVEWALPGDLNVQIAEDKENDGFSLRYLDGSFFFMAQYQNGQAVEVAVDYALREHVAITLYDMDVFQTPAEQLVHFLKQFSPCSYDLEDEQRSTNYEFSDIGVRLWREQPFHPDLLSDESYRKEMALVIDEMYHYLYFEVIAVK